MKTLILAALMFGVVAVAVPSDTARQSSNKQDKSAQQHGNPTQPTTSVIKPVTKQGPPTNTSGSNPDREKQHPAPWWQRLVADPVAVLTALILLVYVGLFWLGVRQTKAVVKAADAAASASETAKRALETLERADVLVEEITISLDGNAYPMERGLRHQHITAHSICVVRLKNYGRTRAEYLIATCQAVTEPVDTKKYEKMEQMSTPVILGSGEVHSLRLPQFGRCFSQQWIDDANAGRTNLFVNVEIAYADVFEIAHSVKCHGDFQPAYGIFALTHQDMT